MLAGVGPVEATGRHVGLYLGAILVGALVGLGFPGLGRWVEPLIWPVLAAALYVTFLQVPFVRMRAGLHDVRFLGAALLLNFVLLPPVVFLLTRSLSADPVLVLGVLLVLLVPCTDWVLFFTRAGGGDVGRTLALLPFLLVVQIVALPLYLWLFLGDQGSVVVRSGPFLQAFLFVVLVPLFLAFGTELWAKHRAGVGRWERSAEPATVPLFAVTLVFVAASQVGALEGNLGRLVPVVGIFVAFLVLVPFLSVFVGRSFGLEPAAQRSLVFTGGTRNSFVVLPLALALPGEGYQIAAAVVAAQILVELLGMLAYVQIMPRLRLG